jgi:hypothetical protein
LITSSKPFNDSTKPLKNKDVFQGLRQVSRAPGPILQHHVLLLSREDGKRREEAGSRKTKSILGPLGLCLAVP